MKPTKPNPARKQWLASCGALAVQTVSEFSGNVPGFLSIAAGAVLGYGINRITSAHDKDAELAEATRDLLTNHDIAVAQSRAIAARLRRYAGQCGPGTISTRLHELAAHAEDWWLPMVNDSARHELDALRDDEVVNLLTGELAGSGDFDIPLAAWQEIIAEADAVVPGEHRLGAGVAGYFAEYHHASFRADFVEALKTDLLTDGKAFAAVLLRFLATLISGQQAIAVAQEEMQKGIVGISKTLLSLQEAIGALRAEPGLGQRELSLLAAAGDRLRNAFEQIEAKLDEILRKGESHSAGLLALRKELGDNRKSQDQALEAIQGQNEGILKAVQDLRQMLEGQVKGGSEEKAAQDYETALSFIASCHCLSAAALRDWLETNATLALTDPAVPAKDKTLALREAGRFVEACDFAIGEADRLAVARMESNREEIDLRIEASNAEITLGRYPAALEQATKALDLADRDQDFPTWGDAKHQMGRALLHNGQYKAALELFQNLVPLRDSELGKEHPDTLASRNALASALDFRGKHSEAEMEHRAVLEMRERVLGAEHPGTLTSRNNLAASLNSQGKHAEADGEFRAVLAVKERALGPRHPDTQGSRINLAGALHSQGKHAEAGKEYRGVFEVWESVLGQEHPDTLGSRSNLALALYSQGKLPEAEGEHRAVLEVQERVLGPEHPDVFKSCYNLSLCLQDQGRGEEALGFARRAYEGWSEVLGENHPHTQAARRVAERLEGESFRWWLG